MATQHNSSVFCEAVNAPRAGCGNAVLNEAALESTHVSEASTAARRSAFVIPARDPSSVWRITCAQSRARLVSSSAVIGPLLPHLADPARPRCHARTTGQLAKVSRSEEHTSE